MTTRLPAELFRSPPFLIAAGRCLGLLTAFLLVAVISAGAADAPGGIVATPLAPLSGPRGKTMFRLMLPAETGIVTENHYDDPRMWGELYQELVFGGIGTGVAIGDYDNDGRPDLLVVAKTGRRWLFRNLGNWKFEDVTAKAGLGPPPTGWLDQAKGLVGLGGGAAPEPWQQAVTFVDVNNDGLLDIYITRFNAPNLLYINQGDGTFKEEAAARGLAVTDACGVAAFCDYDRDGWLDVYIQTNLLDAAKHPNGQRDHLFHNNGDGTFTEVTAKAGISGETAGHSATWWDYDGDGWPDLYVSNDYGTPDTLYHNNRDGTFTNVINEVVPHMPYYSMGADLGDVNNDGLIDLLAADMAPSTHEKDQRGMAGSRVRAQLAPANPSEAPQYMHNALYLNTGTGRMREAAWLTGLQSTDWTWSVRLEDLDNDGRLDAHFTNGMVREFHNADGLTRIMELENPADARRVVHASPVLAESNFAFRNLGDLRFEDVSRAWGLDQKGVSFGAAFGDFDGDGDLDLVFANYEQGVTVLRNDSDTGHRLIVALRGTRSNRFGVGATVRIETASGVQVRQLVLARGYLSSSEPILHFGLGHDTRIKRLTVSWPSGHIQTFTDLAADRHLTVTEPGGPPPSGALTSVPARVPTLFSRVTPPRLTANAIPLPGAAGDVVAAADFDRSGHLGYFIGKHHPGGQGMPAGGGTLQIVRDGQLADVTDQLAPALRTVGEVGAALWSDVDGDGWPDLLVAAKWGPVRYFHNNQGRGFSEWTGKAGFASGGTGWWSALAVADFNGDGRPDYVAGNLGLNTRYRASAEYPAWLFYGDFGGTEPFAIEGYYEAGRLYPWITLPELAQKLPVMRKRYPRNDHYAQATLGEIIGEDRLAAAEKFAATEFRSGVFLSQPDGTYRFEPLPRIAQIAPVRGAVAGDFNGDGKADLYVVQNSFAPPPGVGRFDGGLSQLLLGDGQGRLAPVPPVASGLVVAGEGKAVAVIDADDDGRPDFLVRCGDDTVLAFRNNGLAQGGWLRVILQGPPGNPGAVGARLTLEFADGTRAMAELHAGSDSLGQLPGASFFGFSLSNPPKHLQVRWPSGATTERDVTADTRRLTLSND